MLVLSFQFIVSEQPASVYLTPAFMRLQIMPSCHRKHILVVSLKRPFFMKLKGILPAILIKLLGQKKGSGDTLKMGSERRKNENMCEQVHFVQVFMVILPWLPSSFINCTANKPGTGADNTFLLKHYICRNVTQPSHNQLAIAGAHHIQIYFLPLYFDRLLFVYLLLFMHQALCNIIWHLSDLRMCTVMLFI